MPKITQLIMASIGIMVILLPILGFVQMLFGELLKMLGTI